MACRAQPVFSVPFVRQHKLYKNMIWLVTSFCATDCFLTSKNVKDVLIIYSLLNKGLNGSNMSQTVLQDRSEREGPYRSF